jgi:outer membrane autotransporter protein
LIPGTQTKIIDFTIPTTINGGNATDLAANQPPNTPQTSSYTGEKVYLTKPPTDPNSLYFVPNLPNSTGSHNGLTANIYFVGDPFLGKSGYWPNTSSWPNGTFHLTPYGWASNPTYVAKDFDVQLLNANGGSSSSDTALFQTTPILRNFWKHTIQGYDYTYQSGTDPNNPVNYTVKRDIATAMVNAIQALSTYPFPPGTPSQYLNWLYQLATQNPNTYSMNGVYFHVQPQPGFQRNLLRYYTAWGAVDIYNQSSDLFVRADGTIELPAVKDALGKWKYAPIVAQTWDGSQRYSLLNLTTGQVPSTYDDYPGYEYYLPGNVYLPGKAGVVTTYVSYLVQDSNGLSARQTDLWLGLKSDTANDMLFWADAPVNNQPTEPGGQANKPYMFGASTFLQNTTWNYQLRLQSSNSFCVARLASTDLQGKLYDASFYADLNNGKGYQKASTVSYQWQPWTIDGTGKWAASTDAYGAGVPQLTFADTLGGNVSLTVSQTSSWNAGARVMAWSTQANVDPSILSQYNNVLGGKLQEYFATGTTTDSNTKYLIVLNPRAGWTAGSGDWGTAANWSSGVPGDYNNVYLEQNDGVSRTVTYNNTAASAPSLSMLRVDGSGPGMTLQINTGSPTGDLKAEMAIVGAGNTGKLLQTTGTVTLTDTLLLGHEKTGNGTYTLQGGTFTAANALVGVYGTGTFTQSAGTATISDTLTLAANSGSSGTYNLSGGNLTVNTFVNNGTFNRTGGTFNYNQLELQGGNFVGDLVNQTLLTGFGPITGTVTNSGTVNPGNSPGTLSIVGRYIQTAAGTYSAEIGSANDYDKISVTGAPGTATLAGTIAPNLLGGYKPRGNQVFPGVITATGGVTGAFTTIANQQISPTLFWQARYNSNSVDLWVQRQYTNAGLSLNSNQQRVGTMLNSVAGATTGDLDTVLNAIDYLPDSASVQNAYKQISPDKAGALSNLGFAASTFQMRNLASRTTNLRFIQGMRGEGASLDSGSLNFNYSKLDGLMLAYNGASLSNLVSARKEFKAPESRWGLFAEGGTAFGSQKTSVNQTGYNFSLGGFTAGADYRLRDNLLVGLATGYNNSSSSFYGSGGNVNASTVPFNAYAAYFPGSLYAYGSLGYALNLYNLKRGINFGGLDRTASSSTAGHQFNLYGETGYDLRLSRFILTPSATLAYSALWVDGFTEHGAGALNLKVAAQSANSLQTGLGGRVTVPLKVGAVRVVPQGYAFYQHEFANGSRGLNANLSQGSSTFTFQTDAAKRNFALVGGNVTVGVTKNLYAQVNYNAEVGRGNYTAQSVNAGLRWEF